MKNLFAFFVLISFYNCTEINKKSETKQQQQQQQQPYVLIVQPILAQSDEGTNPASMALPEELVDRAYEKAGVDFHFLEPIYYNNTKARDGLINLDEIVRDSQKKGLIKGQDDIVNMFFVNAVDGNKGPLGRGMMGGNITFITLGDDTGEESINMQAFVIAHEVGHNLGLKHAVDDKNVPDSIPNIQGDGEFKDRIDPKYSLNEYQINLVHKSKLVHSRIEFLNIKKASKAILDESYEPYFSQLQIREISVFTNSDVPTTNIDEARTYAKEKFASAVTNFTDKEKKCISYVVNKTNAILIDNKINLMANQPWRFIKIKDWLCGGYAHTRGTYIILSQRHLDALTKTWNENMSKEDEDTLIKNLGGLLVHEQMHSLQRTYRSKFKKLYTEYWDFKQAKVINENSITVNQVSNPDAPIAEWLIPNPTNKNYYWIRTLLKETSGIPVMGKDFTDKVFAIEDNNGVFNLIKDKNDNFVYTDIEGIEFYKNAFPTSRGLDHPNEISAYMFSDYFKSLVLNNKPYDNTSEKASKNTKNFINWIEKEMK